MVPPSPTAERPAEKADATSPAKPIASFQSGRLSAAIFADKVKVASGKTVTLCHVSLRRSYKTDAGWQTSQSLRTSDLLPAAYLLGRCFAYLAEAGTPDEDERE